MKTIYRLVKWHRSSFDPKEQTIALYESWKDANHEMRLAELSSSDYEYAIYTHKVIESSEEK